MCMCGKPVKNGEPGYSWDGKGSSVRQVDPPELGEGDALLYDEPGRCGGLDSHCHHFRIVMEQGGGFALLVRHGGGDERISLMTLPGVKLLAPMSSDGRYWVLQMLYHTQYYQSRTAQEQEARRWHKAAAEGRIKTRKQRGLDAVKVWIEPAKQEAAR